MKDAKSSWNDQLFVLVGEEIIDIFSLIGSFCITKALEKGHDCVVTIGGASSDVAWGKFDDANVVRSYCYRPLRRYIGHKIRQITCMYLDESQQIPMLHKTNPGL